MSMIRWRSVVKFGVKMTGWTNILATTAVAVAGLWLAHSIARRTQVELRLAAIKRRFEIYPELWKLTAIAGPADQVISLPTLTSAQRKDLDDLLTRWYWERGGGSVLGEPSREIFLKAKRNLIC